MNRDDHGADSPDGRKRVEKTGYRRSPGGTTGRTTDYRPGGDDERR
ncbi:hypothetical protein ACFO5R_19610 [Halosolutus amylolyticus]|uniref:Uncharacterized protein n=1 Tax=Halosolutus amylolyticus TaxID=2932267 RepID=A0ABD5PU95_9EURY|nr:hypothetical protein [Halosolutus amylolyticus]